MASTFPNLSKIPKNISNTIKGRAGQNITVSNLLCWIRVISAAGVSGAESSSKGGLVLESFQNKKDPENSSNPEKQWSTDNFSTRYGNGSKSGRVGTNFQGDSVYAAGNDRAYRPSPIIEGLSVQNGNKGLSRKSTFTIKCFSLGQVEKISEHFLEPGYTVLVEMGWNTAAAKEQKLDILSACNIAEYNNFTYINKKRKNSNGHYDAFLGFITGGGIKSGDGETYLCDVELTTIGEIPGYLQQHKGDNQDGDVETDSDLKYKPQVVKNEKNVGKSLFMQMYNRLPAEKQTSNVKKLIENDAKGDYHNTPWYSAHNFLNIDDEIREKVTEAYSETSVAVKNSDDSLAAGKIPEGAPLFSDQSFIRLELAFKILNTCRYKLKSEKTTCGNLKKGFSYEINIESTICRGFENMFSTDPSLLFIPNPDTPSFGLSDALTSTESKESYIKLKEGKISATEDCNLANNPNFNKDVKAARIPDYAFPARKSLQDDDFFETMVKIDSDVLTTNKKAKTWGYLRNLYINFDFFCETISRSNVVTKDIYYDLLNGISSAANSMWYFEIVQLPNCKNKDDKGPMELTVRDFSLVGEVTPGLLEGIDTFTTKGKTTPFLDSSISFDIPGAMKNHVLGKRISEKTSTIKEGKQVEVKHLFASASDSVLTILNSMKLEESDVSGSTDEGNTDEEKLTEDETRAKNYELFTGQAAVYPTVVDRAQLKEVGPLWWEKIKAAIKQKETATINELAMVGGWKSSAIFNLLENGKLITKDSKESIDPILMPVNFTFQIHGISGLRVGDLFKLSDVPSRYTKGIFQILETSHSINGNQWLTDVKAGFRNTN